MQSFTKNQKKLKIEKIFVFMMTIIIEQADRNEYPLNYVRLDIAWSLFLPSSIGDVPKGHGRNLIPLANWFWDVMAKKSGKLNADSDKEIHIIVPPLTEEGLDFVVRLCSMWSSEIFFDGKSENLFTPPVINIFDKPKGSEAKLSRNERGILERFFTPLLGPSRMFARLEEIPQGSVSARLHSHSVIDEYYLILKGKGHLRFNEGLIEIKAGDLIGKVRGPDNSTQIKADLGETIIGNF
ncbi:MAG: cupin domain-containing protein [Nitrososphaeria archaeon]